MGELLIRHLKDIGCRNITVFNRTLSRAGQIARRHQITHAAWEDLKPAMQHLDIVVAAALTEDYLFRKSFLSSRRVGPLLIIDIAVPRNFDPAVNELEDVYLYSVDELEDVVKKNIEIRQEDMDQIRQIIADDVESFMDWFGVMDIGPLIGKLRGRFQQISQAELERLFAGECGLQTTQREKVELAVHRILGRLLHRLIHSTYTVAKTHGTDTAIDLVEKIIDDEDRPD